MINYFDYTIIENEHLYGPGKRLLLFLQGCSIHCEGCINSHIWPFGSGTDISAQEILQICQDNHVEGVTLHGGEPLDQAKGLLEIVKLLKENNFTIILFTGYRKKELFEEQLRVWDAADIVVYGRYVAAKRNIHLQFRGSTNQRVITHKGKYKNYKVVDGDTVAIFTLDSDGKANIKGFYSEDVEELKNLIIDANRK